LEVGDKREIGIVRRVSSSVLRLVLVTFWSPPASATFGRTPPGLSAREGFVAFADEVHQFQEKGLEYKQRSLAVPLGEPTQFILPAHLRLEFSSFW